MSHQEKTQLRYLCGSRTSGGRRSAFREPRKWMQNTHARDGEKALLLYNLVKGLELSNPMDQWYKPTGNTCFVLTEVYETGRCSRPLETASGVGRCRCGGGVGQARSKSPQYTGHRSYIRFGSWLNWTNCDSHVFWFLAKKQARRLLARLRAGIARHGYGQ